ncbi:uncharacterized protein PFL1_00940 [Pseudozyma flocculosa PF-1]|uniref:Thioredoxin domain-containing protein n=1 Tax=Pseudozyma flocculosa TaxID=84751 RepID=A0A5C3FB71_9BASI|nr:uncharacterized protein PFL1_00940 [Pseudozyma flocculosa PF-1]EPQ31607.1 hypothetical protein PFL1_00940 [Pseudozyma flocculosa PF-1]SPO40721.1 uncharacterized protein PSFLO_06203 [Pseudozyma flocculosa]
MLRRTLSLLLLGLACLVALGASTAEAKKWEFGDINNPNLASLTSSNFTSTLSKGMWLVEFYSPYCKHCKKFAPVWQDLAEYEEHLADSHDFRFTRVNCITQGDLCGEQQIPGFPSIFLWADGVRFEEYEGERDFDAMLAYVEARAADWRSYSAQKAEALSTGR